MRSIIPKGLINAALAPSCCKGNTASVFPYPAAFLTPIKSFKAKIPAPERDEDNYPGPYVESTALFPPPSGLRFSGGLRLGIGRTKLHRRRAEN
jgi:hypothetical protein